MSVRPETVQAAPEPSAVAEYKRILQQVLEQRPAGTRQRLAEALGKNRSFISQITNAKYSVPIPANHVQSIFETCHFLAAEKAHFMEAYRRAHPHRVPESVTDRWRELRVRVPDLGDRIKNKQLEDLINDTVRRVVRLLREE